jgi:PPM family protein phosphatase
MDILAHGQTDVGKKRDHNEDFFLCDSGLGLFVVCDGMGGHAAGEVASYHASQTVQRVIEENAELIAEARTNDTPAMREKAAALVETAVQTACAEIFKMATADSGKAGMGTTLVMILMIGDKGVMGHVGDSRLYMVRSGQIHQLSEDHSYCTEMIKRGKMTREQAEQSPYANVITRAVGIQESVEVDTLIFDILPEDTFLICSDGLHGYMDDPNELAEHMAGEALDAIPQKLIDLANDRGGKDNVTALVVRGVADTADSEKETQRAEEVNLKLETLKKIPLFRYLTYQELVKILNITFIENAREGANIIKEGDTGEELYIVLAGKVSVSRGGKEIVDLHPGVHFGEMALVDQSPRSATIVAKEDTRLLVVERKNFYRLIRKEPVLAVKLLWSFVQVLSRRLRDTNEQLSGARTQLESGRELPFHQSDDD